MNFSLGIGRWFGINVRIHWTMIAYAVVLAVWPWPGGLMEVSWRMAAVALVFGSVLLHEFGHSFAARFCDGESNTILLWPLGGLAFVELPHVPSVHLLTALAGPLVSLALWGATAVAASLTTGWLYSVLLTVSQMNLAIVLFNLLPAFPLDGGRMLQAVLWRKMGHARSMWICANLGMGIAVILFLLTLLNPNPGHVNMLASGVAVFIFFNAWKERQMLANESSNTEFWESRPGVAWNHPYRTLEKEGRAASRGFFGRWRKGSAARRRQAVTNPDEYMRDVVNPILDKIAREGMQSLTRRERQILESAREMIGKKGR